MVQLVILRGIPDGMVTTPQLQSLHTLQSGDSEGIGMSGRNRSNPALRKSNFIAHENRRKVFEKQSKIQRLTESPAFESVSGFLILLNCLFVAWQTQAKALDDEFRAKAGLELQLCLHWANSTQVSIAVQCLWLSVAVPEPRVVSEPFEFTVLQGIFLVCFSAAPWFKRAWCFWAGFCFIDSLRSSGFGSWRTNGISSTALIRMPFGIGTLVRSLPEPGMFFLFFWLISEWSDRSKSAKSSERVFATVSAEKGHVLQLQGWISWWLLLTWILGCTACDTSTLKSAKCHELRFPVVMFRLLLSSSVIVGVIIFQNLICEVSIFLEVWVQFSLLRVIRVIRVIRVAKMIRAASLNSNSEPSRRLAGSSARVACCSGRSGSKQGGHQ